MFVPALRAPVVEPVGAGDAFAAGYLSGLLRGLGPTAALRCGHLVAVRALAVPGDCAPSPDRRDLDAAVALPPTAGRRSTWSRRASSTRPRPTAGAQSRLRPVR